jgi:hypothetical protein
MTTDSLTAATLAPAKLPIVLASATPDLPVVVHFDGWLSAESGSPLAKLALQLSASIPPFATTSGKARRADAQRRQRDCLETLVVNLAACSLSPLPYAGLSVATKNGRLTRYDRPGFTAPTLRACIACLEKIGLITVAPAVYKRQRTILVPSPELVSRFLVGCVAMRDIIRAPGKETVELWATDKRGGGKQKGRRSKVPVNYRDTSESSALRLSMDTINDSLNAAVVSMGGNPMPPPHLARKFRVTHPKAAHSFNRHGRLYGGFWQHLKREHRHMLTVNGEPVADLDFAGMFVNLAYLHQGLPPPAGDIYAVAGLENCRDVVKSLMVSLFFREVPAKRMPKEARNEMPPGWTMARFKRAAGALHPAIAPLFDTVVGFELMATESRLLVAILLELSQRSIPALPMHDGIMVPQTAKRDALTVMEAASLSHLGYHLKVVEKIITPPKI